MCSLATVPSFLLPWEKRASTKQATRPVSIDCRLQRDVELFTEPLCENATLTMLKEKKVNVQQNCLAWRVYRDITRKVNPYMNNFILPHDTNINKMNEFVDAVKSMENNRTQAVNGEDFDNKIIVFLNLETAYINIMRTHAAFIPTRT